MNHSFNIHIAKMSSVNSAIIFENMVFWIQKNRASNKNLYDGRYWTYCSVKAFAELFPYFTDRQVRNAVNKLIESGLLVKGNYNKTPYDRTLWYALSDKALEFYKKQGVDLYDNKEPEDKDLTQNEEEDLYQNCQMDLQDEVNINDTSSKSISQASPTYTRYNTNIKENIKTNIINSDFIKSQPQLNKNNNINNKVESISELINELLTNKKHKSSHKKKIEKVMAFTQDEELQESLLQYLTIRSKKGLSNEQWDMILSDLKQIKDIATMLSLTRKAFAGGYMKIVYEQKQTGYSSSDTTSSNTRNKSRRVEATDDDGNLIVF